MKLQNYLPAFLFFIFLLISCNSSSDKQPGNHNMQQRNTNQKAGITEAGDSVNDLTILANLLKPKGTNFNSNEEGRIVRLDSANQCIALFKPKMKQHGIMDPLTLAPFNKIPMRITEYEQFEGKNLLNWMLKVAYQYDRKAQGANMVMQLKLGIYTDAFLNTYLHDNPSLITQKKDRITIFLVPSVVNANQAINENDSTATAYELGGLYP